MIDKLFLLGFFLTFASIVSLFWIFRLALVVVQPYQSVLILAFGKCREELHDEGIYFRPLLWLPGFRRIVVSRQLDFETLTDLHVNDRDGTTLRVDVWFESRVVDARRSVFTVESWRLALRNLILHTIMERMGHERLDSVLINRDGMALSILQEVQAEAINWGIGVQSLYIQDIRLLPEISKQFFDRVAAQLELKKSRLEEEGRIAVHTMQAETEVKTADLQAEAKSMHPVAIGRAYAKMSGYKEVLAGFQELHQLSLLQPGKVVSFVGFKNGVNPLDVMMMPTEGESANAILRQPGKRH
jgi:regulator of protease activity HflC (stomatin/prohibitin superfamily)